MSPINMTTRTSPRDVTYVVVRFPDSLLAFDWPRSATLAELAEHLADVGERHHGAPVSVAVQSVP